ncbi:hypothetical protein FMEXI_11822 [Fusarium mexicanum]|uniref:Uncharacterized protein n=1 Tax=Fusarium mexicanum TaxID=751941 RepID=A0A8H5MMS1_9HYPO|nr:hypothetical protein FMEXI_11822 [Fusarium mexicanum]
MPGNRPRVPGSTKTPFERQCARNGYRRRQLRRQRIASLNSGAGHADLDVNSVQGVEDHPSDAGHIDMTGGRDQAGNQVQQVVEAAMQEPSTSHPPLEVTRLAQGMSTLAIADSAVQQRDTHVEQPNSGPQDPDRAVGDIAPDEEVMDIS